MKKFIRVLQTDNEDQQQTLRRKLNSLGFYVLSLPDYMLEVNVIEEQEPIEQKLIGFFGGIMKKKKEKSYERVFKYCESCDKTTVHVLETTVTICTDCNQTHDNDADELFPAVE